MLFEGNRAARFALGVTALGVVTAPLDRLLARLERRSKPKLEDPPVIFVVGLPRSGSTVIAERIRRLLPVVALNSAMSILPRSRVFLHKLLRAIPENKEPDLVNYYGHGLGWFASGDTYSIWDQWLGRHHNLPPRLKDGAASDMLDYFRSLHQVYGKPILAKNNRNALLVEELAWLFPKAVFVVAEREPSAVVRSISRATREFGLRNRVWGLSADDEPEAIVGGDVDEACRRSVERLRVVMEFQLSRVEERRVIRIPYETFCADPQPYLSEIERRLGA